MVSRVPSHPPGNLLHWSAILIPVAVALGFAVVSFAREDGAGTATVGALSKDVGRNESAIQEVRSDVKAMANDVSDVKRDVAVIRASIRSWRKAP